MGWVPRISIFIGENAIRSFVEQRHAYGIDFRRETFFLQLNNLTVQT